MLTAPSRARVTEAPTDFSQPCSSVWLTRQEPMDVPYSMTWFSVRNEYKTLKN
jgi:hypothetical protein